MAVAMKQILVLANSIRKNGRCIAGRQITDHIGTPVLGDWIRPVSKNGEGELTDDYCRGPNGQMLKIFDIIDIPLWACENSKSQPENWFIDPKQKWTKASVPSGLPRIAPDGPIDLWDAPGPRLDRISPEDLAALNRNQSLYLIPVTKFRMELSWTIFEEECHKRRRAIFDYKGIEYNLALTDPAIQDKYCRQFPKPEEAPKIITLPSGGTCQLCVSLAPAFHGYHYKVVATVIEGTP